MGYVCGFVRGLAHVAIEAKRLHDNRLQAGDAGGMAHLGNWNLSPSGEYGADTPPSLKSSELLLHTQGLSAKEPGVSCPQGAARGKVPCSGRDSQKEGVPPLLLL